MAIGALPQQRDATAQQEPEHRAADEVDEQDRAARPAGERGVGDRASRCHWRGVQAIHLGCQDGDLRGQ